MEWVDEAIKIVGSVGGGGFMGWFFTRRKTNAEADREVDIKRIIISDDEVTLVLNVFYLIDGERVVNQTFNNPEFILRATPDSEIYRNAQTGAIMPKDDNNPLCIQEYQLFMMMLQQPVKILEMAVNIALEYELYGRYDN